MRYTAAPVADELIEMRGLRFHYRDWAPARDGAPTLVLLHGYTGHARTWDAFAEAMTDRYRVIALDQRGHGETQWAPAGQYGVEEMTGDLTAFVGALGLRDFTLLGLSMGGMVAMDYAGRRPPELARLVIVDIGPELVRSGSSRIQAGQQASDVFASREAAFAAARAADPRPPEAHHRHRVDYSLMRTEDGAWTWRYDRALRSPAGMRWQPAEAGWAACAKIAVPTLIIRGALSDILSPEIATRMTQVIPDATLVEVADAGHSVPLDAPEGFAAAVRGWLPA
jgi:pimeloyl-ACP methyl ester carboxylesterase